jgi:hypothetical protein
MNANNTRAYFRRFGYRLEKSLSGNWTFSVIDAEENSWAASNDFHKQPFKDLSEVWAAWESVIHDKWRAKRIGEWLLQKRANGSPVDVYQIDDWLAGKLVRLPKHLQDDLDFEVIYHMGLPRNWRSQALALAAF